jgi:protein transport protein SEC61 subunit gamma and related proteins
MGLKEFYGECVRVYKVMRKPTRVEFMKVAKITGAGILLVGAIGFTVLMLYTGIIG